MRPGGSTQTANISARIERTFKASPEKVFQAWTQSDVMSRWICTGPVYVVSCSIDARVGGGYRIHMRDPRGEDHIVSGTYDEVVPNQRLVFSWSWITTPDRQSRVSVDLAAAAGGGCHLTLTHDRFYDEAARDGHVRHWAAAFDLFDDKINAMLSRKDDQ